MPLENLRIIRLEAENIKRLSVVEITPHGDVVTIAGRNGQGKTSVLDAILWALEGKTAVQLQPIRAGEEKGHIVLDLGNEKGELKLQVTRRFKAQPGGDYTTSLKVTNEDGFRPQGEQTLLDTLVGSLSFDPMAFTRYDAAKQVAVLKGLVPGAEKFVELEAKRLKAYNERTELNREAKRLQTAAEGMTIGEDLPAKPIDVAEVQEQINTASQKAAEVSREQRRREQHVTDIQTAKDEKAEDLAEIARLEGLIAKTRENVVALDEYIGKAEKEADAWPELDKVPDTAELMTKLNEAHAVNRQVERRAERDDLLKVAGETKAKADECTTVVEECEAEVSSLIARANLPVKGLELADGMVKLRGVPFNQASDAEQLRASMALGMAANPTLRVIRIRDGSLLDEDALAVIAEVAAEENFQIWMERVGANQGPEAIVLEDGRVKE